MKFCRRQIVQSLFFFACYVCISATISDHENWHLLQHDQCGENVYQADRIIGGKKAPLGQYPWIARLGYSILGTGIFLSFGCGAALISERYILTAAHCVADAALVYPSLVRLGENYDSSDLDCEDTLCAPPVQNIKIEEVIVHKMYDKKGFDYDIALIRLEKPAEINDFVVPICLPFGPLMTKDFTGQAMEVAGWGKINSSTAEVSSDLLYVHINMLPVQTCQHFFRKSAKVGTGQMCLGGEKDIDSCTGDSGGPLMKAEVVDGPPKYFLFGVVSFGPAKCGNGPAVYTDVRHYLPWILENIEE